MNWTASLILSSGLSSAMVSLCVIGDGVVPSARRSKVSRHPLTLGSQLVA